MYILIIIDQIIYTTVIYVDHTLYNYGRTKRLALTKDKR